MDMKIQIQNVSHDALPYSQPDTGRQMIKINRNSITILYITVYDTDGIYYAEYAILFSGKLFDIQLILIPLSNI